MSRTVWRFLLYCILAFALAVAFTCMMIAVLCEMTLRREKSLGRAYMHDAARIARGR